MDLKSLRNKIDAVDAKLLRALAERARITQEIGRLKARHGIPVYAPDREKAVYEKIVRSSRGPLTKASLEAIYREIMSASLSLERPIEVAFLGPDFTFTHLAALKKFGSSVTMAACNTIGDVFAEVDRGRAEYGVVPIENSIEGAVNHTLDLLVDSKLSICSEIYTEISHSLLSKERSIEAVRRVYSKNEVFGQCRIWLETNLPRVSLKEVSSTACAAQIAVRERNAACIASLRAGQHYRLNSLAKAIEDSAHNTTRFLVLSREDAKPSGQDKTSLVFSVKDRVGALHRILLPFKRHRLNLTKIESRPSRVRAWEYYFFVDLEGHRTQKRVARALADLKKETNYLKILGSYPMSGRGE